MSKQEDLKKRELLFVGYDETYGAKVFIGTGLKDKRQSDENLKKMGEIDTNRYSYEEILSIVYECSFNSDREEQVILVEDLLSELKRIKKGK